MESPSSNAMFPDRLLALSWDDAWVEVGEIVRDHAGLVLQSGSYPLAEFVTGDPGAVERVAARVFDGVYGEVLKHRDAATVKRLWTSARAVAGFAPSSADIADEEPVAAPSAALGVLLTDVCDVIGELVDHCLAASLPDPVTSEGPIDAGFDLESWAARLGLAIGPGDDGDLLALGGGDVTLYVTRRSDAVVVERGGRGPREPRQLRGSFSSVDVAVRYLVMAIGAVWRAQAGRPRLGAEQAAPGTMLEEGPTAYHLSWSTGWAEFPKGVAGRGQALEFSRFARTDPTSIAQAYDAEDGVAP